MKLPLWTPLALGAAALGGAVFLALRPAATTQAELPPVPEPSPPPPPPPPGQPTKTTALTAHLSDGFLRGVDALAAGLRAQGAGVQAEDFLAVFKGESPWQRKDINPAAISVTGCAGINQICNLKGVGWTGTKDEYRALTAEQQLPWAARYFDQALSQVAKKPPSALRDAGDLYCLNFAPAYVGKSLDTRMTHLTPLQYQQNAGLDTGGKGYIDVRDMGLYMQRQKTGAFWRELVGRLADIRAQGAVA